MDFQVNYAALDSAAADIKTGASNLQSCLDDLVPRGKARLRKPTTLRRSSGTRASTA